MRKGGHGAQRDGGGRGGVRRRVLDVLELRVLVLRLMVAQPRHGYDVIREIETMTGGAYAPSPGIVYPTLALLEEQHLIAASASAGPKKLFALTRDGRAELEARSAAVDAVIAKLHALRAQAEVLDAGPVGRALQNLNTVIEQRFSSEQEKQMMFVAADLIDEVARKIERL